MGEMGAGKSSFIRRVTGRTDVHIGHSLAPETREVTPYDFTLPSRDGRASYNIRLVDCPGFDDITRPDEDIVISILNWLGRTYHEGQKLHGIIYTLAINRPRMTGQRLANISMFRRLVGDDFYRNVILGTTLWDQLSSHEEGVARERELRETQAFWKSLVDGGSRICRIGYDRLRPVAPAAFRNATNPIGDDVTILLDIAQTHRPQVLAAQDQMAQGVDASQTTAFLEYLEWGEYFQQMKQKRRERLSHERCNMRDTLERNQRRLREEWLRTKEVRDRSIREQQIQFAEDRERLERREAEVQELIDQIATWRTGQSRPTREFEDMRDRKVRRVEEIEQREEDEVKTVLKRCTRYQKHHKHPTLLQCSDWRKKCKRRLDPKKDKFYRECCPSQDREQ